MEGSEESSQAEADVLGLIADTMAGVASVRYELPVDDGQGTDSRSASGFLISEEGYFVTLLPPKARSVSVQIGQGQELEAELVGTDPLLGIGLLKLKGNLPLEPVPMGSAFEVTEQQVAVSLQRARGTGATVGYIAGITAAGPGAVHLVASAALPVGSQGGPLLDLDGRVIGVVVSGPDDEQTRAIPVDLIRPVIDQLKAGEPLSRSSLGVDIQPLDDALARSYGVSVDGGVVVGQVTAEGPADGVLRPGDLIRRLAGAEVDDPTDIAMIVGSTTPGTALKVDIQRAGSDKTVTVKVGARSETATSGSSSEPSGPQLAANLESMTPDMADKLGRAQPEGVLITGLHDDAPTAKALAEGDIILDVAGISVGSPEEVQTALARQPADKPVRLVVSREGRVRVIAVEFEK